MSVSAIRMVDVSRRFEAITAVEGCSLDIAKSEVVCLVGPSGCGKTTVLNMLAGFDFPTSGSIVLGNRPVVGPGPDRTVAFQQDALFPWLTVRGNVSAGPKAQRHHGYEERAMTLLEQVHLSEFADHYPYQLSGGMRQRAAIARALVVQPQVLLMDEPFGALDAQTRMEMQILLQEIWASHKPTIVFITHDIEEALILGDRVEVMSARPGRIVESIRVPFDRPRTPELALTQEFNDLRSRIMHLLQRQGGEHGSS